MQENKPIRILHILQRMEAGGTQALLMNLYRNIDRNKIQFDFLVEYPDKQFYDDEIISLGGKIYYTNVRNDYNVFKFKKQLKDILKNHPEYQIVHVHAFTIGIFCLSTAKKCGVKTRIAHSHNNETVHDKKYLLKRIMQNLYPIYATDLMACSENAGKYLFGKRNFKVLNNAIDSKKFTYNAEIRNEVRKELKIDNNFVVGHVGRFHPQKNHKFLIDIFEEILKRKEDTKLLLIGSGPLENDIKQLIKNKGLSKSVILLGNRSDMTKLYQAMDVFVFPSLFEGLGIVSVESQAAGVYTITSNRLPDEVKITPIYKSIPLESTSSEWAEQILDFVKSENKKIFTDEIIEHGYDLSSTSEWLQKYYINKSN